MATTDCAGCGMPRAASDADKPCPVCEAGGRDLPGGSPGRVGLGGDPPGPAAAAWAADAVVGAVGVPAAAARLLCTLPGGGCLYARAVPTRPDAYGRPTQATAKAGARFYDGTAFSFENASPDPSTQSWMTQLDNTPAFDFLLPR